MTDKKRVIALGFFDGVHLGHAALLNRTNERAREINAQPSVLSFDVHPDRLVFGRDVPLINDAKGREDIIHREFGIEDVVFIHFDRQLMCMPWQEFADTIISELHIAWIVVGHDFCFGYRGEGTAERLKAYCEERGIGCDIIPAVTKDGRIISSTYIRELLSEGKITEANRLLGHPHTLTDTVHTGFRLGRKLEAPTINMFFPDGVLIPKHGVYAAKVRIEDGESRMAVTNIGIRPTVSEEQRVNVESHLLDYSGDLYGKLVRVEFYEYLREEKKFSDLAELSKQIRLDAERTREYFQTTGSIK